MNAKFVLETKKDGELINSIGEDFRREDKEFNIGYFN